MDKKYKDIHIFNKKGEEILTRRQCINICIKDNLVIYATEYNKSILLGDVCTTIHELVITDTSNIKIVID